ncbi:hypothetical protein KEJ34_06740 [Candidatus Bathyarchaeota archaeon]|nr:hypothetical protein [Candidatus Bathyarchaeota archaeon]
MIPVEIIEATLILMTWSLLYKDNPLYKLAASMTIGLYLGVTLNYAIDSLNKNIYVPLIVQGKWLSPTTIVFIIGLLLYTRFIKSLWWLSRWPLAILSSIGLSVAVTGALGPQIIAQLSTPPLAGHPLSIINGILGVTATVTSMCYFVYSREHKGVLGALVKIGRIFLMIAFGFMLGTFLMSNIAFAIQNMSILAVPPGAYISAIAAIILIIVTSLPRVKKSKGEEMKK